MLILLQGNREAAVSQDRAGDVEVRSRVGKHDPRLHKRVRRLIKRGVVENVIAHRFTEAIGASIVHKRVCRRNPPFGGFARGGNEGLRIPSGGGRESFARCSASHRPYNGAQP